MSTNKLKIPKRATEITPFYVMDILEKAKEMEAAGKDVIHLEVGEPDFQTPDCIKEKAIKTITEGKLGYTPSLGLIELRKAIAGRYKEKYGVNILPEQVVVTSGSSPALQMVFSCLLEEGDEVIMTDPHYACYSNFVKFLGGKPLLIKTEEDENFRLSPDEIKKNMTGKSKVILINSPANPTGVVMSAADMEAVSALGLTVISDEIYHGLVYDGNEHSILEFDKDAFVIDGFSKRYAMTGWRLGYAVVPQRYIRTIQCLVQNFLISAPTISQWGGLAALEEADDDLEMMRNEYKKRRDFLLNGLDKIGLEVSSKPAGAFYVLVNMKQYSNDSLQFAYDLLENTNVAVTPGIDFGEGGEGFIRLSYATSIENIEAALSRIEDYLKKISSH